MVETLMAPAVLPRLLLVLVVFTVILPHISENILQVSVSLEPMNIFTPQLPMTMSAISLP